MESWTTLIGKHTIYQRYNTDSKFVDIAHCKASKSVLLVVENAILIRYYFQTAKTRALNESIDGPTARPADNPPNSDGLGVHNRTIHELTVRVHWQPGLPIWQRFSLDRDTDAKWLSTTIANTTYGQSSCTIDSLQIWTEWRPSSRNPYQHPSVYNRKYPSLWMPICQWSANKPPSMIR